jgi:AraC-like DNA-binding protein
VVKTPSSAASIRLLHGSASASPRPAKKPRSPRSSRYGGNRNGRTIQESKAESRNPADTEVITATVAGLAPLNPWPSFEKNSDGEPCFLMAPSHDRIEFNFRASAGLRLSGGAGARLAADHGQKGSGQPGAVAPRFVLDVDADTTFGRFGTRLTRFSVALRLSHENKTLWGAASTDMGAIAGSVSAHGAHLSRGVTLLHRGSELRFETGGPDSTAVTFFDVRRQANVCVYLDESLVGQIPMAALAQLVRLSECHFCRTFKRSFGFLPRGFRIGLRIVARPEWAAVRGLSVGDFALTVDFVATGAVPAAFPQARDDSRDRWLGLADLDS